MLRSCNNALVLVLLLGDLSPASADPLKSVGVDATLSVPLSPWIHATGIGGGGSIWLHLPVTDLVEVTARLGATVHADRPIGDISPGARSRLSEIPLLGGARYRLTDGTVRGYLEGEVGLIFRRVDVDVLGLTDNSARIRLASSLGAAIEVDRFDLRAAVWLADLSDLDGEIGVIVSAGARFYRF
ncbi:MAG TPA: hypothetical protein VIV58_04395 [Kofleriaceae bacterium]